MAQWSKTSLGKHRKEVQEKLNRLSKLQDLNSGDQSVAMQQMQKEIDNLLKEDNVRWKQRAKQTWLKDGDRNTKFFHRSANQRRKINEIKGILRRDGSEAFE